MVDELRDRIAHWTALSFRVVSETPTSAELDVPADGFDVAVE